MATEHVDIVVTTDGVKAAKQDITELGDAAKIASGGFNLLVGAIGALAAAFAGMVSINAFIDATSEMQAGQAQLAAVLRSTGNVAGQTIDALNEHASALQKTTIFGDDAVNKMQALLLTFKNIRGENFTAATEAIADLATALGTDLNSAALQVGKALNDPAQGLSMLGRAGIQFSDAQEQVIKQLAATGRMAEAQKIILAELESQFGGSAEAARNTLGGALAALNNAFGDLFEVRGAGIDAFVTSINSLVDALSTDAIVDFANTIGNVLFGALSLAVDGITMVVNALPTLISGLSAVAPVLATVFGPVALSAVTGFASAITTMAVPAVQMLGAAIMANPLGLLASAVVGVITVLYKFREELGLTSGLWQQTWDVAAKTVTTLWNVLQAFWAFAGPTLTRLAELIWNIVVAIGTNLVNAWQTMWGYVRPGLEAMLNAWNAILDAINAVIGAQAQAKVPDISASVAKEIPSAFDKGAKQAAPQLTKALDKGSDSIEKAASDVGDTAAKGIETGGKDAADLLKSAIDASANVMAAKFEGTGRNIYDLWNNWGNAFVDNMGTTLGELLVQFQEAQTRHLNAQAELLRAQAERESMIAELLDRGTDRALETLAALQGTLPGRLAGNNGADAGAGSGGSGSSGGTIGPGISHGDLNERARRNRAAMKTIDAEATAVPNEDGAGRGRGRANNAGAGAGQGTKIINVFDTQSLIDVLNSAEGQRAQINVMKARRAEVARILGVK